MPSWYAVAAIIIGLSAVIWVLRMIARSPLGFLSALLRNLFVGCAALLALDYVGKSFGIHVPLNGYTAGVASVLGVPGVAAMAVIDKWII
ncbi:MAG: pro-sigmaK processing inhibitor BofA family protein [Firmicutes bacterium]|nr:pro-sigmaK processing inhibitor BofA family protein [Bacillota bacterium]